MTVDELCDHLKRQGIPFKISIPTKLFEEEILKGKLPGKGKRSPTTEKGNAEWERNKRPQTAVFNTILLWCMTNGHERPLANQKFHPTRKWEIDIFFPQAKIGVELNGVGLGHSLITQAERDWDKLDAARRMGIALRGFSYRQARAGDIEKWLAEEFEARRTGHYQECVE